MSTNPSCPRAKALLSRAGVFLFYAALWAVLARLIDQPLLLPSPGDVVRRLLALLPQPMLYRTLGATLLRTLLAYGLGIAAAVLLGALCLFSPFEKCVSGLFSLSAVVYYLSVTALFLFFTCQTLEKRRWN